MWNSINHINVPPSEARQRKQKQEAKQKPEDLEGFREHKPEELPTPSEKLPKTTKNPKNVPPSDERNKKENKGFNFASVCFEELNNGKIKCEICQTECIRLMSHLNGNMQCRQYLNMEKFKIEFTKYKARKRKQKQEAKQKDEDLEGFRKNHNSRVKKHEQKKKEEDPEVFRENTNKRQREVDAKN